jgi:hypothetical protein
MHMNKQKAFEFRKILPYFTAILVFCVIIVVYFYPALEGKKLSASDVVHFQGMSKEIVDYREKTGEQALWTGNMFGGMPSYQVSVNYSDNLMIFIHKIIRLGFHLPIGMVIIYFLGFYYLLLVLRINPWLSIAGAIAFAFSSYFFIIFIPGHTSKAYAIGYMAPVLASVIMTYRGKYLQGAILTAFFLALEITCNHPQITYYLLIMVAIYGIIELINHLKGKNIRNFIKASALLLAAALIAVLTNTASLWNTFEYSKFSIRGKTELTSEKENRTSGLEKDYATNWSYGIPETMTLLIPNFNGGSSQGSLSKNSETYQVLTQNRVPNADKVIDSLPLYWGTQPSTSGPVYVGAIVFFLFIFSLFYLKGPLKWWGIAVTILSITLSWGKNFMPLTSFFLDYFPLYNKFRSVTMILVMAELSMPMLAFIALDNFIKSNEKQKALKYLLYSLYIVGGVLLFFILLGSSLFSFTSANDSIMGIPDWLQPALVADRQDMFRNDAIRSLIFVLLTFGILWAYLKNKIKLTYIFLLIPLLILVDMWPVNKRYVNNDDFVRKSLADNPYQPSKADQAILQDKDPSYRVYDLNEAFDGSARTSYFHKNLGGYHGAKMRRFQELVDQNLIRERVAIASAFNNNNTGELDGIMKNLSAFNMLNTRYFIISDNAPPLKNPYALGNAWFVKDYKIVNNADEEIAAVEHFSPDSLAIIDKRFESDLKGFSPSVNGNSKISFDSYSPDILKYHYSAASDQLAVFSEIYYPKGWNAYIDGKKTSHFRADYVLRAMILPTGDHQLEFRFEPRSYYTGQKVSLAASLLTILLTLGVLLYYIFPDLATKWQGKLKRS